MTLTMADSISAANLPSGYDAYAGYTDGQWPSFAALSARFPTAHLYSITVTGGRADEADCETGDLTPAQAVSWANHWLAAGVWRPGIYASVSLMASGVLPELAAAGVARGSVRLRSAHYGAGEHICGPATCKLVPVAMDGTQWTETAAGENGSQIDASLLADDFFAQRPAPAPPFPLIEEDNQMELKTGNGKLDVARPVTWMTYLFLATDVLGLPATPAPSTTIRVALHTGGVNWKLQEVTLDAATPTVTIPLTGINADVFSFERQDDYPNPVAVSWR